MKFRLFPSAAAMLLILTAHSSAQQTLDQIIAPDAEVTRLGSGMKFTEGPVWIPKEKRLVWSDIPNSRQMQWTAKDGISEWRKVEASNGNLLDLDGNLLSCQHAGRNLISTDSSGKITVLADKFDGKKFNSPNDLAIKSDGTIWFTDPTYGLRGKPGEIDKRNVYHFDPKSRKVSVLRDDFDMPNGIAFSPDEKIIYISDTGKPGKIRAFEVPAAGRALEKELFKIDIRCDGMCIDVDGNVYTTAAGGIHVFDKDGEKIGLIKVDEHPANVCFGGDDFKTLYITARTSLYSVKVKKAGARPKGATTATTEEQKQAIKSVASVVDNQRNRMAEIQSLKDNRLIGENRLGLLNIRHRPAGDYGIYVQKTVDAENADRTFLMSDTSTKSGEPLEDIRKQQWQTRIQNAFPGEWIEVPGKVKDTYTWIQKNKSDK